MAILTSTTRPAAEDLPNLTKTIYLKALLKEESRQTSVNWPKNKLRLKNDSQSSLFNGICRKIGSLDSHKLSENNKENRLQIASQHLARHRATRGHKQRFLYRIVTGDEKWCLYINMKQRKEWDTSKPRVKPNLHPRKTMICIWWDWEGMVHWEMLERNATVNKEFYIAQLHRVNEAIRLKRPH